MKPTRLLLLLTPSTVRLAWIDRAHLPHPVLLTQRTRRVCILSHPVAQTDLCRRMAMRGVQASVRVGYGALWSRRWRSSRDGTAAGT
jgi:hypothetical protein